LGTQIVEPGANIDCVYFSCAGVVSDVTILENGKNIEVATIGNEGFVGLSALLGGKEWTSRMIVQVPGRAYRMEHSAFLAETKADAPLRQILVCYYTAYLKQMGQAVARNGAGFAEVLDLASALATALADAIAPPEGNQRGHGQAPQAIQQNRLGKRRDQRHVGAAFWSWVCPQR
jgi:CRP-like cAMP-binding protein